MYHDKLYDAWSQILGFFFVHGWYSSWSDSDLHIRYHMQILAIGCSVSRFLRNSNILSNCCTHKSTGCAILFSHAVWGDRVWPGTGSMLFPKVSTITPTEESGTSKACRITKIKPPKHTAGTLIFDAHICLYDVIKAYIIFMVGDHAQKVYVSDTPHRGVANIYQTKHKYPQTICKPSCKRFYIAPSCGSLLSFFFCFFFCSTSNTQTHQTTPSCLKDLVKDQQLNRKSCLPAWRQ